jgi:hypothetical protein
MKKHRSLIRSNSKLTIKFQYKTQFKYKKKSLSKKIVKVKTINKKMIKKINLNYKIKFTMISTYRITKAENW